MNSEAADALIITILASLLSAGPAGSARAEETPQPTPLGPLKIAIAPPFFTNNLITRLRSGFSAEPGSGEWYLNGSAASVWINNEQYSADFYHNQLSIGTEWQLSQNWQVALDYSWRVAGNNQLDALTIHFHDLAGISQNGRIEAGRDQYNISAPQYEIDETNFEGETLSNALTLYAGLQLVETAQHGVSLGSSLFYNHVSHGPFAQRNFEYAGQLNYSYRRHSIEIYSSLGFAYRPSGRLIVDIPTKKSSWNIALGCLYLWSASHQLLLGYYQHEAVSTQIADLSNPSHELTLGYRYLFAQSALELALTENIINMNNSNDIAVTLGFRQRF